MTEPRLHQLARLAWSRISVAGHDPIEAIVAALLAAKEDAPPLPSYFDTISPQRRKVVLVLADGQAHRLQEIQEATRTSKSQTWHLLKLMVRDRMLERLGVGVYRLAKHAPKRQTYRGDPVAGAYCTTRDLLDWLKSRGGARPCEVAAYQRVSLETARSRVRRLWLLGQLERHPGHRYVPTSTASTATSSAA